MKHVRLLFSLGCLGLFLYLCAFKVGNSDFWWHIKAGQVLRESGWISLDPFAYTRIGEAYLATHEWLAQVILSTFYDLGTWAGITILRIGLIGLAFGIPLLLHRKNLWVNSAVAVLAVASARPALTDRPQLFTFVLFSLVLCLCIAYPEAHPKKRKHILLLLPVIIILWSNLHGAASLIGIALFGALYIQQLLKGRSNLTLLSFCLGAMLVAPFVAPGGIANITYLYDLFTEKSAGLIEEWKPGPWGWYLKHTAVFWILGAVSLWYGRRNLVFSLLVFLGIGYLSRTAQRHEILFIITSLTLIIYQLRYSKSWNAIITRMQHRRIAFPVGLIIVFIFLGSFTYVRAYDINRNDHLYGFGVFAPMRSASAFIKREQITGNMFNNYNAGGELLFYDHKVFLDGRNLDYGYEYVLRAVNAGMDPALWDELEQQYNFTHAVIYYSLQAQMDPLPYTDLLDADPDWSLVYLDDWAVVYRKVESGKWKMDKEIMTITPKNLENQKIPREMGQQSFRTMESELNTIIRSQPEGVKGRMYLAKLYTAIEAYDEAQILLLEALAVQPNNFRIYLSLTKLGMERGRWNEALVSIKRAKRKAGFSGVSINEDRIEEIRQKALSNN